MRPRGEGTGRPAGSAPAWHSPLTPLLSGLAEAGFVAALWSRGRAPDRARFEELWLPSTGPGGNQARRWRPARTVRPRADLAAPGLAIVSGLVVRGTTPWADWTGGATRHATQSLAPWSDDARFEQCVHLPLLLEGRTSGALTLSRPGLSEPEVLLIGSLASAYLGQSVAPAAQPVSQAGRRPAETWFGREAMLEEALQPLTALRARLELVTDLLQDGQLADLPAQLSGLQRSVERLAGQVGRLTEPAELPGHRTTPS